MTAISPMTPAQGRFLTALLDDLTAVAPAAGAHARDRARAMHAEGTLTKAEASRVITVLKQAIDLAKGFRLPTSAQVAVARQFGDTPISAREQALLESRRANAAALNLTPGKRPAKRRSAPVRGGGIIDSLRTWTPERAAQSLASSESVPF